jgi:hypothetical protein
MIFGARESFAIEAEILETSTPSSLLAAATGEIDSW